MIRNWHKKLRNEGNAYPLNFQAIIIQFIPTSIQLKVVVMSTNECEANMYCYKINACVTLVDIYTFANFQRSKLNEAAATGEA